MEHNILLGEKRSVLSLNTDNRLDVALETTSRPIPHNSESSIIDQNVVFEDEIAACNQYRLVLLIKPYCTNVLFNTVTEIVKNEGSGETSEASKAQRAWESNVSVSNADGNKNPNREEMIANTEYSKSAIGYNYLPGLDIFDNHLFRSSDFRIVNKMASTTGGGEFNTYKDTLRYSDGTNVGFACRSADSQNDPFSVIQKTTSHMYGLDNFINYEDSIVQNLVEDSGWVGFTNNTCIQSMVSLSSYDNLQSKDIGKILNNRGSCEFVDMYPDRTLYSFNPKFNQFRKRLEYNWNITLTYPCEIDRPNIVRYNTKTEEIGAIPICDIEKVTSGTGRSVIRIRTYVKHNLMRNDKIQIYYLDSETKAYKKFEKLTNVIDVGNGARKFVNNYFTIDESDFEDNGLDVDTIIENKQRLIFRHSVNGVLSDYYVRIFKKLPNLKRRRQNLTEEIASDPTSMAAYVSENATNPTSMKMYEFDREQHQAAFASTIYSDRLTEVVFTDTIDLNHIKDHRGRPLTSIYATIVKNNKGHKEWYTNSDAIRSAEVEFSHCFGYVSSGFRLHTEKFDIKSGDTYFANVLDALGCDVSKINNLTNSGHAQKLGGEDYGYLTINGSGKRDDEGVEWPDKFYGDLVEFIPTQQTEYVLEEVYHRFNTAQRELATYPSTFTIGAHYHNITSDDYDGEDAWADSENDIPEKFNRPEGYFYKAHHRIPIRQFDDVQQGEYRELTISSARPIIMDKMHIQVTCSIRHKLAVGDIIRIKDDSGNIIYLPVTHIVDRCKFTVPSHIENIGVDMLINYITSGSYKVCVHNSEIPSYATEISDNVFVWRNVLATSESDENDISSYPYANNHFYIEKDINFFLRRQDPYNTNGLYCVADDGTTNVSDIEGNPKDESNYEYIPEAVLPC